MAESGTTHGLHTLKRVVSAKGIDGLDARTSPVRAVNEWRTALVNDLGGESAISTQKAALINVAARTMLYLNHLDAFLMSQPSLVNRRKKAVLPVLRERQTLVDSLARLLGQLGLQRQAKPVKSLAEHIAENYGDGKDLNGGQDAADEEPGQGESRKEVDDADEK